ncbi:uncharacterized protein SCHCODRAFT_02345128 [Schizophyllum commune H4-8]|uniref:uncharacterized protein n=1 Tax=Schizophyllum commune (strain H4-8 / FGSC 9210) TaxID=578458 RepID=UPI00215EAE0E|nr:uncharacterized protein SCHCODRAFT_02345128 [Schizophyllum commune H4-8]KAI5890436.1 hypothetical protein SCHCODRAFT_02345128 [Schizophyllum commune H4-8]
MRSRSLTPPMASPPIISESEAENARPTVSERGSRATSYAGSLCTIAEDPNDDLWVEPKLKAQYEALLAQQNQVAPVAVLVHRRKAKSASSVAKDCRKQGVDRPTELFLDRGVVFGAFPPFWRGLNKEHPMWRVKDLLLRRLCDVEPLPRESLNESHPLITKFDVTRMCFERSAPQGGDYVILRVSAV